MTKYSAFRETLDSGMERIVLTGENSMVQIAPGGGLNLYSWVVEGRELMMPTQDVGIGGSGYGTPVLFPTPNRIRDCTYTWRGETHTMQKNGKERFIHGLVLDEPFDTKIWQDDEGAYCEGVVSIREGEDMHKGYPFPCEFVCRISLKGNEIAYDFTVTNKGEKEMPFGVAIHPYFTKAGDPGEVYISSPGNQRYEVDEKLLPSGRLFDVAGDEKYDLTALRRLGDTDVDTVYAGISPDKASRIEFRDWGLAVELSADADFKKVVVFTPHHRPGFCIEPQTCATDFINMYNNGFEEESGILTLNPGEIWQGTARMCWGKLHC